MISKKTLFVLTLIAIDVITKASASSAKTGQPPKKQGHKKKSVPTLSDTTSQVRDVPVEGESIVVTASSEEQPAPLVNKQFERLIEQEKYEEIEKLGASMTSEDFLKQVCLVVKTLEHYNGLYECLKRRGMGASFFVHGRMEVVREVIAGIKDYDTRDYIKGGDLDIAVLLALKEGHHDRAIDLFVVRQERTAKKDEQHKQKRWTTSFEYFVSDFFDNPDLWKDSKSLKRFMTLKGEEFNNKHPAVYEIFCQELAKCLRFKLYHQNGKKLMVDLIAQPALLTPVAFVKGFLWMADDNDQANFVTYSWREAVQEGLKKEYPNGSRKLWKTMTREFSDQFSNPCPYTDERRAAVCKHLKTKQQLEEAWAIENIPKLAPILQKQIESLSLNLFPTVLLRMICEYAVTWVIVEDTPASTVQVVDKVLPTSQQTNFY